MRIVVFGPEKRVGSWEGDEITDLHGACAKYLWERQSEPHPYELAGALVPPDLRSFIEGGSRSLDYAQQAAEYLTNRAGDRVGIKGEPLIHVKVGMKVHPPLANPGSPIACMGTNYVQHAAAERGRKGTRAPTRRCSPSSEVRS